MPELPEVEVSRMGIAPHLINQHIKQLVVHQPKLRWPVPDELQVIAGEQILDVRRRAKYLLIDTHKGSMILHLGMSGKLCVVASDTPRLKHDHIELQLSNGQSLRFNDARRFGACLWQAKGEEALGLMQHLGPEPLTDDFDGERLYELSRGRSQAIKTFIMDNKVVVGVGNIYANESLFLAGIDPRRAAGKVSKKRYLDLAEQIKQVLAKAISKGGTTLKDFTQADGKPGYFAQELLVYGRAKQECTVCNTIIRSLTIGQRNSFYCPQCQK